MLVDLALAECDALVLPTLPIVAPTVGAADVTFPGSSEPFAVRPALLRLTQLFNITGHPAISLPVATAGLPVGLQLVGHLDRTKALLDVAASVERVLG
jgi:aspartyl-tRNA(Asn)/glutamyl-tRNA(Gln) amidotransferase subunit A